MRPIASFIADFIPLQHGAGLPAVRKGERGRNDEPPLRTAGAETAARRGEGHERHQPQGRRAAVVSEEVQLEPGGEVADAGAPAGLEAGNRLAQMERALPDELQVGARGEPELEVGDGHAERIRLRGLGPVARPRDRVHLDLNVAAIERIRALGPVRPVGAHLAQRRVGGEWGESQRDEHHPDARDPERVVAAFARQVVHRRRGSVGIGDRRGAADGGGRGIESVQRTS